MAGLQFRNSKLILCPFCFFDKIDGPFCLQNCFSFGCPFCSNFTKQILSRPNEAEQYYSNLDHSIYCTTLRIFFYIWYMALTKFAFFSSYFAFLLWSINLPILLFRFTHFALSFTHFAFQKFLFCIL